MVLGGVTSGVGKGIVCASIGNLLIENGIKTTVIKYDGLMNYSFEQMNPYHVIPEVRWSDEEVTVLADGGVVDSDLGVYERFTGLELPSANNIVNGQCLKELISYQDGKRWRAGEVISVFPHLIDVYKEKLFAAIADNDVAILEVGGTVGDFESEFFLRMVSNLSAEMNLFVVQLSYLAFMGNDAGAKNDVINQDVILKPIKQSFHTACSFCLKPDALLIRSEKNVGGGIKSRISKATCLKEEYIFFDYDVNSIYDVPEMLKKQGLMELIMSRCELNSDVEVCPSLADYSRSIVKLADEAQYRIAIIGLAKRIEEVFFPNDPMPYYLDRTGEPLKVIMHLRDEAHRFDITFHRNKRSAGFVRTQLEEIEGIGTKTADLLLRRFRSVARIRRASEEELADAVGTAKARRVYAYFHDGTPAPDRPGEDDGAGESPTANGASDA